MKSFENQASRREIWSAGTVSPIRGQKSWSDTQVGGLSRRPIFSSETKKQANLNFVAKVLGPLKITELTQRVVVRAQIEQCVAEESRETMSREEIWTRGKMKHQ